MAELLLKSTICLIVFLGFYLIFLEKESRHVFKRYYLLVTLFLAFIIPNITFTNYVSVASIPYDTDTIKADRLHAANSGIPYPTTKNWKDPVTWKSSFTHYLQKMLWIIYGLGVLFFGLRFGYHFRNIVISIRKNQNINKGHLVYVLLSNNTAPYTFLNYIFLSRTQYNTNNIQKEVLCHEVAHAEQKHSLDVICIELLQIILWFIPMLYFYKKAIKLNHEFLADSQVLKSGSATTNYQNTLLSFSIKASENNHYPIIVNAFIYSSYSSIKKRFTIMTTKTSKQSMLLRSLLFLPLLSLLILGFSNQKQEIQIASTTPVDKFQSQTLTASQQESGATPEEIEEYNALAKTYNKLLASNKIIRIQSSDVKRLQYLYGRMTKIQRNEAEPFPDFPKPPKAPVPPKSPVQNKAKPKNEIEAGSGWVVSARTNRNSREESNKEIPPTLPVFAFEVKPKKYSKELKAAIHEYSNKYQAFELLVNDYTEHNKGTLENLWDLYNESLTAYVAYYTIAEKEGKLVRPMTGNTGTKGR